MARLLLRSRGALVAIVVLVLTAGAAFAAAAPPPAADAGLATAKDASGQVVPVRATNDAEQADEDANDSEDVAEDAPEPSDASEVAPEVSDNHGALVSQAAQGDTPDWATNHGQYVSCVARLHKDPAFDASTFTLDQLTPEMCGVTVADPATTSVAPTDTTQHGKSGVHGKAAAKRGHGHGGK